MKKECKSCNILFPNNKEYFYSKNLKKANGISSLYFEPNCKKCCIKRANICAKKLTAKQVEKYAFNKNKKRKVERRKERAKEKGVSNEAWCLILKLKKKYLAKENY